MKTKILFLIATLAIGSQSFAWREGNGGDGVKIGNKIYLLDLVEAGNEQLPIETPDLATGFLKAEIQAWAQKLSQPVPEKLIASKLGEIAQKNQVLALAILTGLQKLTWNWVSFQLTDLKDEGNKLKIPREQLVQLALRVNQTIQIQKQGWDQMDDRNKVALLFHEVVYALMVPERSSDGMDMNSPRVRTLIGFLFSKNFLNESMNLVLTTEAPHLSFPTTLDLKINPTWTPAKDQILMNRRWVVETQIDSHQTHEKMRFGDSSLTNWLKTQCHKASQNKQSFVLGLQADTLKVDFLSKGIKDEEEFFLSPNFGWETWLRSVVIEPTGTSACLKKAEEAVKTISSQWILNY